MHEPSSCEFRQCLGVIDFHVENVLMRLHDEPIKDVSEDVMVLCSTDELKEAREKLFVMAKRKVHGDEDREGGSIPLIPGMKSITDPWGLIARRSKKRLDEDVCKLYLFNAIKGYKFPYKILKRGTMREQSSQRDIRTVLRSVPRELACDTQPTCITKDGVDGGPTITELHSSTESIQDDNVSVHEDIPVRGGSESPSSDDDTSGDESDVSDSESCTSELPAKTSSTTPNVHHETIVPTIKITPPTSDIGVQCMLVEAPALQLLPKKDSPILKQRHIEREMARNHEESWDDLIEAEQIVNQQQAVDPEDGDDMTQRTVLERRPDPVGRDEFEGHVEFQDRALSEHEDRINALESRAHQSDHRVDVVDAVLHEKMRLMSIRQGETDDEMVKVRQFITGFLDQVSHAQANSRTARSFNGSVITASGPPMSSRGKQRGNAAPSNQRADQGQREQRDVKDNRGNGRQGVPEKSGKPQQRQQPSRPLLTPGVVYSTPKPTDNANVPNAQRDEAIPVQPGPNIVRQAQGSDASDPIRIMADPNDEQHGPRVEAGARNGPQLGAKKLDYHGTGARPKVKNQGNIESVTRNDNTQDVNATQREGTYAEAATKYPWQTPEKRKRKRDNSGTAQVRKPVLKGVSNKGNRELSVLGLSNDGFKDLVEIEDAVRSYCRERGVELVFIKVFERKHELNTVGCKIAVKAPDANAVTSYDFWPEDVHARKWHRGNKNGNGEDDRAGSPRRD